MKIAVLLGGTSAERDVSLVSGITIAKALSENGHSVQAIDCAYGDRTIEDWDQDEQQLISSTPSDIEKEREKLNRNIMTTMHYLLSQKFDMVYNALHGGYGENGQLQALLDLLQIPYTGSGPLASALGMNKHLCKIIFQSQGIPTSPWVFVNKSQMIEPSSVEHLGPPIVVKPNNQGSTVGLSVVQTLEALEPALQEAFQYGDEVLIERYIPGHELTVSILVDNALPVIEIIPESGLYDYEAKYQAGKTRYVVPAEISIDKSERLKSLGLAAYRAIGCQDYARVDFRMQEDGQIFCLEVNTLPGMTPTSLVPKAAKAVGINFRELVERIVQNALCRRKEHTL